MSRRGYGEAMSSASSMVDWDLAGRTARRLAGPGPQTTREDAAAVVRELHQAAATAVAHVEKLTGMTSLPGGPVPEVAVVDRPGWVDANARGMAALLDPLVEAVRDPRAGAVVTFAGVTREVSHLDYEAYAEMAGPQMEQIVEEAIARHGLCAAVAAHRSGRVELSEPSVLVAVSAPHRPEAFEGAREIIDRIKAEKDCLQMFRQRVTEAGLLEAEQLDRIDQEARQLVDQALAAAKAAPAPTEADLLTDVYASY